MIFLNEIVRLDTKFKWFNQPIQITNHFVLKNI